ncbi:MAG: hypothetical protein IAG10_28830, partial [Planctomycetaceae bacterium]|nr:hypothetical protein [Planctomycetaceae bacterium]
MSTLRRYPTLFVSALALLVALPTMADEPPVKWRGSQQAAVAEITRLEPQLKAVNKAIWEFAEVGLEERRSSALLVEK